MTKIKSSVSVTNLPKLSCTAMDSDYAPMSIWAGINAITQVETSTRGTSRAKGNAQFARGTFGAGATISKKAFAVAKSLIEA